MKGLVASALAFVALLAGTAVPAAAQSLEIRDGSPVRVETLSVRAMVEEGVALVDLEQTFRNPTPAVREGTWTVRLPEDAVVHTFSMWMEGREKQGRVIEAAAARAIYDSIVRRRKDPALLEEIGWRTFRVSVFPIPANDTVRVRLRYAHVVPDDLGTFQVSLPMPDGGAEIAAIDVDLDVRSAPGLAEIEAPGREGARVVRGAAGATLRWSAERTAPRGPFVARFTPAGEGISLALLAHRAPDADEGHFVVRIVPRLPAAPDLPRDVVFVVDRSGSMQGGKIEQARAALLHGLGTLRRGDRFGVVSFATDVRSLGGDALVPADESWIARARAEAGALDASGGTNLAGALEAAVRLRPAPDASRLFVVVCLTDGDPTVGETNPDAIVNAWRASAGDGVRLFALGVGRDVRDFLLTRLAEGSRGAAQYVGAEDRLESRLASLFERVRTPLLVDPEIEVRGVETRSVEPRPLPDVFRGGAVVLAGAYRGGGPAELVLRGRSGADPVELRFPVVFPAAPVARPHVAQIWARMRIDRLVEDLRRTGAVAELRQEITSLGVRHQVVSPYTSFLVVEDGVPIPDDRESARVPEGPAPDRATDGAPRTSTGSGAHALGSRGGRRAGDSREPSDPPPQPEGGGPGTPGGEDAGGPTTGGGASPPTSGGGGGPTTGGARRAPGPGPDPADWNSWWEYESDALLAARAASRTSPLPRAFVEREVVPLLRARLLDDAESDAVRAAALEGLAKLRHRSQEFDVLVARLQRRDGPAARRLVERALLVPVWLDDRSPETRARLLNVVADAKRPPFERSFAMISLALLGTDPDGAVARALLAAAAERTMPEVAPAAYAALALLGDRTQAPALLARLDDATRPADAVADAWLVRALGRLRDPGPPDAGGAPAVSRRLRALLEAPQTNVVVRRAVPGALAALHDVADAPERRRIVAALRGSADSADASVAGECLVALGRIASGDECPAETARAIVRSLASLIESRATAPAVAGHARVALALAARGRERDRILPWFRDEESARLGGRVAYATAWMLAGDADAAPIAARWAADARLAPDVRARAALAVAVLGAKDVGSPFVRSRAVDAPSTTAWVEAMVAVSVAGSGADPGTLAAVLQDPDRPPVVLAATARALGRVGDPATAASLAGIASAPQRHPDLTRALALAALADLAAARPHPFAPACEGFLPRAWSPPLWELRSIVRGGP